MGTPQADVSSCTEVHRRAVAGSLREDDQLSQLVPIRSVSQQSRQFACFRFAFTDPEAAERVFAPCDCVIGVTDTASCDVADDPLALQEESPIRATQTDGLEIRDLDVALARLPPEQRAVLLLVALEEMTYKDVAKTLGIPVGTVMSRLARSRDRLRLILGERESTRNLTIVR